HRHSGLDWSAAATPLPLTVIPAKAGIQRLFAAQGKSLDSGFRRNDGGRVLRDSHLPAQRMASILLVVSILLMVLSDLLAHATSVARRQIDVHSRYHSYRHIIRYE
ncbi:hypothetical protein, partial [Dyella japonica]|uniref:hypothetical protein n=1 Tax=Dyella japonica TaxID=231455 RepID=UPI001ED965FA